MTAPRPALPCILDGWAPGGDSRPANKGQPRGEVQS